MSVGFLRSMATAPRTCPTLMHVLGHQADVLGETLFTRFLSTAQPFAVEHTFASLDRRARRIAAHLQTVGSAGDRALLLHPDLEHSIEAFFGCMYAGLVAVPVRPPDPDRLERAVPRLRSITEHSGATLVLAPELLCRRSSELALLDPALAALTWLPTDQVPVGLEDDWARPDLGPDDLALLRYTAGP